MNDLVQPPTPEQDTNKYDRPKFGPSKSNMIYFGILAAIMASGFFANVSEPTPEQLGTLTGRLVAMLALPLIISWVFWLVAQDKRKASSVAFNVVLTLVLFGQINQRSQGLSNAQEVQELVKHKEGFKDAIANAEDMEAYDKAYLEYSESIKDGFRKLSEDRTGDEKVYFRIMAELAEKSQEVNQAWMDAYNAVLDPNILNYEVLVKGGEYENQKEVIRHYIKETKVTTEYFSNYLTYMEERLREVGNEKLLEGTLRGARKKVAVQMPIMEPLMKEHLIYADNLIALLDVLESHQGKWAYEEETVLFDEDEGLSAFNLLMVKIGANEIKIQALSQQLVEVF